MPDGKRPRGVSGSLLVVATLLLFLMSLLLWRTPGPSGPSRPPWMAPFSRFSELPGGPAGLPVTEMQRETVRAPDGDPPGRERAVTAPHRGVVRVSGQVRRHGIPVPGYELAFKPVGSDLSGTWLEDGDWEITGGDGRYQIELSPTRYAVLNGDAGPWLSNISVPEGLAEVMVDIDLPPGVIRGRVVRDDGEAIGQARVYAVRSDAAHAEVGVRDLVARGGCATSAGDGTFVLPDLPAGSYTLMAGHRGMPAAPRQVVLGDAAGARVNRVVYGIVLAVSSGDRGSGSWGSLQVTVCDRDGAPVRNCYLDIRSPEGGFAPFSLERLEGGAVSDAEGRIDLRFVLPGSYRIAARSKRRASLDAQVDIGPRQAASLHFVLR